MSTEALLTVATLLAAVYQLLPTERRMSLRLRIRTLDVIAAVLAVALIHYIKFFPVLHAVGVPAFGPWRWGFEADSTSYLILMSTAAFVSLRLRSAPLHFGKIETFQDLAESLLFGGRYAELLSLLERYLPDLGRMIGRADPWARVEAWVKPRDRVLILNKVVSLDGRSLDEGVFIRAVSPRLRAAVSDLLSREQSRRVAERVLDRTLFSQPFVEYLAKARPYFALDVLQLPKRFSRASFLRMYVDSLMRDRDGVLYEEIRNNQNSSGQGRYEIDPLNPLVHFFFGEPFRAEELALYKPVGDLIISRIRELNRNRESDQYRKPLRDFFEEGKWGCPIFAGRCLFDYMVTEGLHRGVHWHLWLMYFEYWVTYIVHNMEALDVDVDLTREWPTPYHFLLYDLFDRQRDWITAAASLDRSLASVQLKDGTIASEAIDTLAKSLRTALTAPHFTVSSRATYSAS